MILSLSILHLVENPTQAMDRINQLLKPGGVFISATPCLGEKTFVSILMNIPIFLLSKMGFFPSINFFQRLQFGGDRLRMKIFKLLNSENLSVHPLRECFIVARKAWKAGNHASSSLVVPDAPRHVLQGHKKGNVVITAGHADQTKGVIK